MLQVCNLSIAFNIQKQEKLVVEDLCFSLEKNKTLAIVGESGSGKSISCLSLLGLLPKKIARISSGSILYKGVALEHYSATEFQKNIRAKKIAMIFQDPMSSLNPSMRCGKQITEVLLQHFKISKKQAKKQTLALLEKVQLSDIDRIYKAYPHQISGGQKQRILIAMAIACKPDILIADEPTTALDVTVQKQIIALLKQLQQETKMGVIFISHDITLVEKIADNVLVLYRGKKIEYANKQQIFNNPTKPYTKALLQSRPPLEYRLEKLPTVETILNQSFVPKKISALSREEFHKKLYAKKPILSLIRVDKIYTNSSGFLQKKTKIKAVNSVSFCVYPGETMGLVGESGSGKSTLGKIICSLENPTNGSILYQGRPLHSYTKKQLGKEIQMIFQDPYGSLHPRICIGKAITEPMKVHGIGKNEQERKEKALLLLKKVGLQPEHFYRYAHEFSGGQRQRIGIARAIAIGPKLIVCDESVSALDVSVQAQVLNLLNSLKKEFNFTYIFISHDIAVVKYMADSMAVLHQGTLVEKQEADTLWSAPSKTYTKTLFNAIPERMEL